MVRYVYWKAAFSTSEKQNKSKFWKIGTYKCFQEKKFVVHFDILHIIKYDFYERHIINLHIGPVCISAS